MDSSTIIFIATLAVAFIFLRWLISPVPDQNEAQLASETAASERRSAANDAVRESGLTSRRRPVTESMIEVVQTIAPSLTREQIILDLNTTGSVELTIEKFMETGSLPPAPVSNPAPKKPVEITSKRNLLERYDIDVTLLDDALETPSDSTATDLHHRKQEMIIAARKRLAALLTNEVPL